MAHQVLEHVTFPGRTAMFKQEHALIVPKHEPSIRNRHVEVGLSQRALDMRGHVVGTLFNVPVKVFVFRDEFHHEVFQVMHHIGTDILLDKK